MARRLKESDLLKNGHGASNYDWDTWLGGGTWELKRGFDYYPRADLMRQQCYNEARKRGLKVSVKILSDEKTLHVTLVE